eukprot:scaffold95767_cov35-Prasinocladus_malaysianus.AAC.1
MSRISEGSRFELLEPLASFCCKRQRLMLFSETVVWAFGSCVPRFRRPALLRVLVPVVNDAYGNTGYSVEY